MKKKYYGDEGFEEHNELQELQDALKGFDEFDDDFKKSEQKEELIDKPTYVDLLNMLNDCVSVLKEAIVDESLIETYGNVIMNAENMLLTASTNYEINQRKADSLLDTFEEILNTENI
jgi:hypothetical protein